MATLFKLIFLSGAICLLSGWGCQHEEAHQKQLPKSATESYLYGFSEHGIQLPYASRVVGSSQCMECHAQECDQQHSHHMAQTGSSVTDATRDRFFAPEMLALPYKEIEGLHGIEGSYHIGEDGVWLEMESPDGDLKKARADIAFG